MKRVVHWIFTFLREEDGLEAVELLLLLIGVLLPITFLLFRLSEMVAKYYSYCSWIISLPFP